MRKEKRAVTESIIEHMKTLVASKKTKKYQVHKKIVIILFIPLGLVTQMITVDIEYYDFYKVELKNTNSR